MIAYQGCSYKYPRDFDADFSMVSAVVSLSRIAAASSAEAASDGSAAVAVTPATSASSFFLRFRSSRKLTTAQISTSTAMMIARGSQGSRNSRNGPKNQISRLMHKTPMKVRNQRDPKKRSTAMVQP